MLTFRAMNTDVSVIANDGQIGIAVAATFAEAERRFSRFDADSELSQLNRTTEPMVVSAEMFEALQAARRYVELTDGIFDPAIGATLIALGYDKSFTPGGLDRQDDVAAPHPARFLDVELDATRREVTRPRDVQIDLGGMIKGRTVDRAAAWLPSTGAIDAGGDAVMRGTWDLEIEDPRDATRTIAKLRVHDRAVATSAANRRRWQVAGSGRHHIIDPRTQRSAATDLLQVTVLAPSAELAEVIAKTVFVLGERRGREFVAARGVEAVMVRNDGTVVS